MTSHQLRGRLTDRFAAARERGFVGRRRETAVFESLLARGSGAVLYVYGPGGIGKTTLLHHFARVAGRAGRPGAVLDAREVLHPGGGPAAEPGPGTVLLLDSADAVAPEVLRDELPALLLPDTVTVLAARTAPEPAWRVDPAWHGLLHPMALGPLDAADSGRLLRLRGVREAHEEARTLAFARGHPLALALSADVRAQGGTAGDLAAAGSPADSPQIVQALLDCLLETAPSPLHRTALDACAQVLVTTEPLLAELLDIPDARPVFAWLRTLSAMEYARRGIRPHDLVREALDAELRWRHPDLRAELRRRAGAYYHRLFDDTDLTRQRAVLADYAYLHRESPLVGPLLAPALGPAGHDRMERLTVAPTTAADLGELCALAARHEGADSADLLRIWWSADHPGEAAPPPFAAYTVYEHTRDHGRRIAGCYALVWLTGGVPDAVPDDPAVVAARTWLAGPGGLRAGEQALLVRFWMAADSYQSGSPTQTLITLRLTHHYLTGRRPALTLLPFADPGPWVTGCAYVDFARLPAADFTVAGVRYGVFAHDWRRTPGAAWLRLLTARGATDDPLSVPAPAVEPTRAPPDRAAFTAAVREALRALGRADGLAGSPLLTSRLVRARCAADAGPRERAAALREAIGAAAAELAASVADRRAHRALHHTYLQPAGTQQRAADLLGLPMTTYRRHLAAGTERLTALLWREELEGGTGGGSDRWREGLERGQGQR
ncbi:hypothetical protein [Streptomyces sp. cg36]|uniref:hypothetical protein n=1 Tax=Streptomyces sp. cg36 TaxID=3238798 RepID=UPI0034E1F6CC